MYYMNLHSKTLQKFSDFVSPWDHFATSSPFPSKLAFPTFDMALDLLNFGTILDVYPAR